MDPERHNFSKGTKAAFTRYNLLKVLCGLGALTIAWVALNSPSKPNNVETQSLAALNSSVITQAAINDALLESLRKAQESLNNERKQLLIDQELLGNEKKQFDLEKWAVQRQFIRDCFEYQMVSRAD